MPEEILRIEGLRVEATIHPPGERPRGVVLVHEASLTLAPGRVLGLIGESGAGKSTIGLAALGYGRGGVRLTAGRVVLGGTEIRAAGPDVLRDLRGRRVTYVAQSAAAAFNPAKRLMEQVIEATLRHGLATRAEAEARAVALFRSLADDFRAQVTFPPDIVESLTDEQFVRNVVDLLYRPKAPATTPPVQAQA